MLALPEHVQHANAWQHAARLAIAARQSPGPRAIAALTDQIELALFLHGRLDLSADKRPPAGSIRTRPPARRKQA
jgi:hypothetical protein